MKMLFISASQHDTMMLIITAEQYDLLVLCTFIFFKYMKTMLQITYLLNKE
jgi:hypothetical protein